VRTLEQNITLSVVAALLLFGILQMVRCATCIERGGTPIHGTLGTVCLEDARLPAD
jgi:hypothetical protein